MKSKICMTSINDFNTVLNEIFDEQFPNTIRYCVQSGDFQKDIIIELRENGKALRYSPYDIYKQSTSYEESIQILVNRWKAMLG